MSIHNEVSDLAGETVSISIKGIGQGEYTIEDWWDRVHPCSWMSAQGNPAALKYAMRSGFASLPLDNEVVYGKLNGLGHIVHVSEIAGAIAGAYSDVDAEVQP